MGKKRILIIDDEQNFTRLLKLNLEKSGSYEVREENRGPRGLAAAREFKPDLILLDIVMPYISGDEVAGQIQEDESLKKIPIVFLTAIMSKEEVDAQGGLIGCQEFLAKPASPDEVMECIERHLGKPLETPNSPDPTREHSRHPEVLPATERLQEHGEIFYGNSRHTTGHRLVILISAILLATGAGFFGYNFYIQTQQLARETSTELQRTKVELSLLRASASEAILKQQETIEGQRKDLAAKEGRLHEVKAMEALFKNALKDLQGAKASNSRKPDISGRLLNEIAPSVVKLHCLASPYSKNIRRGTGILFHAAPNNLAFGRYYIQTSLHVVNTTDGSTSRCTILLYRDHAKSNSYLLFKSDGYKFYREDLDVAFLEPELIRDSDQAGTFDDLALYARDEAGSGVCESVVIGDHISILGYPKIGGENLTVTDGIISGFEVYGGARYVKTSAKMDHGNSGGVAVKDSGCLVGIPTFVLWGQAESIGRILDLNYLFNVTLK